MYWLGIDIGTGGSRAVLIDEQGRLKSSFTSPHEEMRMERPMWAEQHPDNWWHAAQRAIAGCLGEAGVTGKLVRGAGLSGQMHGLVILDDLDRVIRPALIWCDQRSQRQVDWINETVGKDLVLKSIANPVLTGFTLPKLLWVREHEPGNFERARKMLLPKDYIRFRLTGEFATEVSDASGTALFDVVNRRWSYELADQLKIDRSILPKVYESSEVTGKVSVAAAKATGLEPGIVSCTLGTSGVVFAHMEQPAYDPAGRLHTFCHAVTGKWHVMGVTQGAGLSLQWSRNQLAPGAEYDALMKEAAQAPTGCQGLFWLPYLMGERTPHLDPSARGGWIGLTARHSRADLIRAVIEGVSFSQKDCLDIVEAMGAKLMSVRASGGGAKSAFWRQMLADVFDKRVVTLETQEGSAYGAALLAAVGTGVYASAPEACARTIREVDSCEPRRAEARAYSRSHQIYKSLYPALKPVYEAIGAADALPAEQAGGVHRS